MSIDRFFYALKSHWVPLPPGINDSFLAQTKEFVEIERRLRDDDGALAEYDSQLYPELVNILHLREVQGSDPRRVLHLCTEQIQLMENVFLALNLTQHHAHALNRGWMNVFRRWTSAPQLQLLWPSLRGMYSRDFVRFAEYQLNLISRVEIADAIAGDFAAAFQLLLQHQDAAPNLRRMFAELAQEWPPEKYADYFEPFVRTQQVWVVRHAEARKEIWGFAALAQVRASSVKQLMVWIRPGYRGTGLGTKLLEVADNSHPADKLVVLLPPLPRDRPGYAEEMAGWLRFYGQKQFVLTALKYAAGVLGWTPKTIAAFLLERKP